VFSGGAWDKARNKDQWAKIPADHKAGTMVSQADWYKILGDPPKEPITFTGFLGGWGQDWVKIMTDQMTKEHPGIQFTIDFDPRESEKMQPKIVAGDIPDWMYSVISNGADATAKASTEGALVPMDFLLDVEAFGFAGKSVNDIMYPGAIKSSNSGLTDHLWTMPMVQYFQGIYYNATLFETNKWPSPDTLTWEDFMDLTKQMKEKIAPWIYQGKYPGYFDEVVMPLQFKKAGPQAFCDMDNLVKGAFNNPDLAYGYEQIQTIFKNGWVYPGSEAMTHTESQQIFVDGKAAMIPCGSWLENEQKATTPKDFRMKFSAVPAPKDAKGFAKAVQASLGSTDLNVGNGKNPLWGLEIMRHFYSPAVAKYFAETVGTPIPIKDAMAGAKASDALASGLAGLNAAEGHYPQFFFQSWYPTINKPIGDAYGDILWSKLMAKDIAETLERGAEEGRADSTIKKYTRTDCA